MSGILTKAVVAIVKLLAKVLFFLVGLIAGCALVYFVGEPGMPFAVPELEQRVLAFLSKGAPTVDTPFGAIRIESEQTPNGLTVQASCEPCSIQDARIADRPLGLDKVVVSGVVAKGTFQGNVSLGSVNAKVRAKWHGLATEGSFTLPETPIAEIYQAIGSIAPEGDRAKISGTVSGEGVFTWPEFFLSFKPVIRDFAVNGLIDQQRYKQGPFEYYRRGVDGVRVGAKSGEGTPGWLSHAEAGEMLRNAVIASEDDSFYSHQGYDVSGMVEAAVVNRKHGEIKRGGSTLTQQLAKNLFLDDQRTYLRKLRELLYAVEMEKKLGKRRILELYLNVVEWGVGVYGAREAARVYFDKTPRELLPEEAAWLASILKHPRTSWQRQYVTGRAQTWHARLILKRMKNLGAEERQAALQRGVRFAKQRE